MPCCPQHLIFETLCIGHIVKTCVKGVSKFLLLNARVAKLRPINLQSQFCDTCSHTPFSASHFSPESWAWTGPMQRIVQYARLAQHAAIHEAFGVIQGPPIIMRSRIANPGPRSPRRPLLATSLRVHAHPADSADTPRQTHAHRTRCSPLQTHARAWCWGRIDTQHHTTVNPTRDRMPPGCHVYGSARDSRGNAGHKTAMRHTRMPASLSPALLPRASVTPKLCTRQEGRGAHTRRGGPGPCLAGTYRCCARCPRS